jgi:hypothetical protein
VMMNLCFEPAHQLWPTIFRSLLSTWIISWTHSWTVVQAEARSPSLFAYFSTLPFTFLPTSQTILSDVATVTADFIWLSFRSFHLL